MPLKRGLLSGRFDEHATFVEGDRRRNILAPDRLPAMVARVRRISEIVADYGRPLAEVAIRFCVSNPDVDVTIPGIRTPERAVTAGGMRETAPASLTTASQPTLGVCLPPPSRRPVGRSPPGPRLPPGGEPAVQPPGIKSWPSLPLRWWGTPLTREGSAHVGAPVEEVFRRTSRNGAAAGHLSMHGSTMSTCCGGATRASRPRTRKTPPDRVRGNWATPTCTSASRARRDTGRGSA